MSKNHKILCVDDEVVTANLVKVKLGKIYGKDNIIIANNGKNGLDKFKEVSPDLVILDIMMPDMDGFTVYEELKKLFESEDNYVPVIFLSAKADKRDLLEGMSKGVSAYLTKPFDTEMLIATVDSKLKIKELQDRIKAMKNRYQAIIAHDMRSPAGAIDMTAQSLMIRLGRFLENIINEGNGNGEYDKNKIDDIKSKMSKGFENIRSLIQRQLSLVDNITDFSKLTSGDFKITPQEISLSEQVDHIIQQFGVLMEKKNVTLTLYNKSENRLMLDELAINQIITNLLSNAVKFTDEGGNIKIVTGDKDDDTVFFTISDTGSGIDEELRQRLFKAFSKGNTKGSKTGLGLYITKKLVEAHHGAISVTSESGKGTTFYFELKTLSNKVLT